MLLKVDSRPLFRTAASSMAGEPLERMARGKSRESVESGSCIRKHGWREISVQQLPHLSLGSLHVKLPQSGAESVFGDLPEIR